MLKYQAMYATIILIFNLTSVTLLYSQNSNIVNLPHAGIESVVVTPHVTPSLPTTSNPSIEDLANDFVTRFIHTKYGDAQINDFINFLKRNNLNPIFFVYEFRNGKWSMTPLESRKVYGTHQTRSDNLLGYLNTHFHTGFKEGFKFFY